MTAPMNVGIYIFEDMTMLDGYAPLQMLAFVEQFNTFTFAKDTATAQVRLWRDAHARSRLRLVSAIGYIDRTRRRQRPAADAR